MDWQLLIAGAAVAASAWYVGRQAWRTWFGRRAGCGGGCGCAAKQAGPARDRGAATLIAADEVKLRRRPEAPQALVLRQKP